ncbi:carbohydrate kinase family protein [Candidatus Saccharibacteria bacterium]|nr:carbohydrate kinase family protein [Candidatus Saccharibacteria bacterium]
MARIVSLGSALQDLYLLDHDDLVATEIGNVGIFGKIILGSKIDVDDISHQVGGGGVNSAITFARHGHEAMLIANIGHDPGGAAIIQTLTREGINTQGVHFLKKQTTGTSVILLEPVSGERTILTCRGASEKFDNLDEKILARLKPEYLYTTTLRGDMETMERFFQQAKEIGAKIMLNPGVLELEQPKKLMKLLKYVDILLVNSDEASKIVEGMSLAEMAVKLRELQGTVIITNGAAGGVAANEEELVEFNIYEDVKTKDMTGAGDAFGAGFLAAVADGKSFHEALTFASANATSVVSEIGANQGALRRRVKLHELPMTVVK